MEEFDDTLDVGDIDDLIDELEGGEGEFGFGGSGGSGINFTGGMFGEIPSFEPMDPFESFFGSSEKPFQTPGSVDPFEFPFNNPATSGPGGAFSPSAFEPPTSSGPSLTTPTSGSGYTIGTPGQTAASMLAQALAAEQTRHNKAQEALAAQELALKNQLAQAQMRAAAGDPTAAGQMAQIQGQIDELGQQKLALEQQKLAAEQSYREGLLSSEAARLGLSQQELEANLLLSREKLAAQIDQFNKTYGLDWMKNAQAVEQFNQRLGFDYWSSGNDLLFNTWQTQMQQASVERGQNLDYNLGLMGNQTNQRGQDLSYNLGAGRLNLDAQGQMFDQSMELSNLAANPRNLAQSLIMMGLPPSAARDFIGSTPLVSTWMNHSTDLDRMPYQSAVPFEYGDNDLPLSFLPAGNGMRGYGFLPPSMQMPYQNVTSGTPGGMLPTGPMGSIPPPNFNMTPPPPMNVPPMTPGQMSPEPTPAVAAPAHGTIGNTAPPMTPDMPQAPTSNYVQWPDEPSSTMSIPSYGGMWEAIQANMPQGAEMPTNLWGGANISGYPARRSTGSSVIPNRGLDPYYGSSTRKQGK